MSKLEIFVAQHCRHFLIFLMVCLVSLFNATPVRAIPSLPSSFYGEVKVNRETVPDGSVVRALIDGRAYAESYTQTYQGVSVYVLDIPSDDGSTTMIEGGREGDIIQFEVAGILSAQTGVWQSGTNVRLDLTAVAAEILIITQATPSPLPTQTTSAFAQSLLSDPVVQPVSTPTGLAQPFHTAPVADTRSLSIETGVRSQQASSVLVQPSPVFYSTSMPVAPKITEESSSIRPILTVTLSAMIFVIGGSFWLVRKKFFSITKSNPSKQHNKKGGL